MQGLSIISPDDLHLHLRGGDMLRRVLPHSAKRFARGLIMPNVPAITNVSEILAYKKEINSYNTGLHPLMTIKIDSKTTKEAVYAANDYVVAGKLYPAGVTTGSAGGVSDFDALNPVFEAMQSCGMVICLHGEVPGAFCLDRESKFLSILSQISNNFPNLKIVLEHITTDVAVEYVKMHHNVAATITAHHLVDTLDSVIGDLLSPHRFCKPIPKYPKDRDALRRAATSGNPKFFFGSDSAPHEKSAKECASGCAGCFTAPTALETLAEVFEEEDALDKLENFVSKFGADFYGLPQNTFYIYLAKNKWIVPNEIDGIVPWRAGEELRWKAEAAK